MRTFIVADETINTVVNWLWREIDRLPAISEKLKGLGVDTSMPRWAETLGHEMFQLHSKAVAARHGSGEAGRVRKRAYRFGQTEAVSLEQVSHSLECWLYQCCEGEVRESALYLLFATDIRLCLMHKIIDRLDEYEEAEEG